MYVCVSFTFTVSSSVFRCVIVSVCVGPFRAVVGSSVPDPLKIGTFLLFFFFTSMQTKKF